jgi:hypothetical protein
MEYVQNCYISVLESSKANVAEGKQEGIRERRGLTNGLKIEP